MNAEEQYFSVVQSGGTAQKAYPAVVATGLRAIPPELPAPAMYGHPRANENACMQGTELLAAQAMTECPAFKQMMEDHRTAQEVLQVVHQSLTFILNGNKAMYVPADEIQAVMSEMAKAAEQFTKARKLNPNACISQLRSAIGPGSQFAHRYRQHFAQHHPHHPNTFEPHSKPTHSILGHDAHHEGHLHTELGHHFGYPSEII